MNQICWSCLKVIGKLHPNLWSCILYKLLIYCEMHNVECSKYFYIRLIPAMVKVDMIEWKFALGAKEKCLAKHCAWGLKQKLARNVSLDLGTYSSNNLDNSNSANINLSFNLTEIIDLDNKIIDPENTLQIWSKGKEGESLNFRILPVILDIQL